MLGLVGARFSETVCEAKPTRPATLTPTLVSLPTRQDTAKRRGGSMPHSQARVRTACAFLVLLVVSSLFCTSSPDPVVFSGAVCCLHWHGISALLKKFSLPLRPLLSMPHSLLRVCNACVSVLLLSPFSFTTTHKVLTESPITRFFPLLTSDFNRNVAAV